MKYLKAKKEEYRYFKWLLKYKDFIKDFCNISKTIEEIKRILKNNGFNEETKKQSLMHLEKLKSKNGVILKEELTKYFIDIENNKISKKMLICSDIIESSFGKYKNYVSNNKMAGVTSLILCLSAFTSTLSEETTKKALESTTINDIKRWSLNLIGKTVFQKRREAFSC